MNMKSMMSMMSMRETNDETHTLFFCNSSPLQHAMICELVKERNTLVNNNKLMICCFLKPHFCPDRLTDPITLDKIGSKITSYSQPQDSIRESRADFPPDRPVRENAFRP